MTTLLAIVLMVLVMVLVGYALARLAEPAASCDASSRETRKDRVGLEEQPVGSSGLGKKLCETQEHEQEREQEQEQKQEQEQEQSDDQLVEEVNQRLPQTQCAQCGHPGCRPYAEAIIRESAPINQCPPGGVALIEELANLLGTQVLPLDSAKGETKPAQVAVIIEPDCIGCTLCIAACPVDAIVGAQKYMHTVVAELCTGCELCLPPCPVDCIELQVIDTPLHRWQWPKPA